MPSSITLTVSHLPTSTSFFLSALQPLAYAYRGRSGQTIGFGPSNSAAPPDFWITQEIPGVPAGAAHVAFPATSQRAVRDFFSAALKAGGKFHGEPAQRDAHGYYSAAIIDFDGNSIEAVYRPGFGEEDKENDVRSVVSRRTSSRPPTMASRTLTSAAKSPTTEHEAGSSAQQTPSLPKGDVLDNILGEARNTANVARGLVDQIRPQLYSTTSTPASQNNEKTGDTIIGTLLGVAAGAALHYAFASRKSDGTSPPRSHRRPSVSEYGRSYTEPQRYSTVEASSQVSRGQYITMQDNNRDSIYSSTIHPSSQIRSRSRASRRGSLDSGIGISPPSSFNRKSMKMLDAPPSAYKASNVMANSRPQAGQSDVSARSRRGSSSSRTVTQSHRQRSSSASRDAKTVLHIREILQRTATDPQSFGGRSTASRSRHSQHSKAPEQIPLPPSRAATWADSTASKSVYSNAKSIVGLNRVSSEASQKRRDLTQSVVGKINEQKRMDLPSREVGPEDSVSQVSSVRGSRRGR